MEVNNEIPVSILILNKESKELVEKIILAEVISYENDNAVIAFKNEDKTTSYLGFKLRDLLNRLGKEMYYDE